MPVQAKQLIPKKPMLGKLIRQLRRVMNLWQGKFAKKIGMSFLPINCWGNERSSPYLLALNQIEMLL